MYIDDTTGKITPNSLNEAKNHLEFVYSYELNGNTICQSKIFETLNGFYKNLNYQNKWLTDSSLNELDFRFQTFSRIELHSVAYHLSIVSTKNDIENLINECLSLGYSFEMAIYSVGLMREVNLRISFWDRFFYTVEYFVQQMNTKYNFIDNTSTHSKQDHFQKMLDFFEIGSGEIMTTEIVNIFSEHYPDKDSEFIQEINRNLKKKPIKFAKIYEYTTTIRNSLHNNGYSNKTLNNLDIGLTQFKDIKKGKFINCLSVFQILSLAFLITEILQRITQKSIDMSPNNIMYDPYTKELDDFMQNSNKRVN